MKTAHVDPRIARTRKGLREALGKLLRETSFESLTLNEVAEASSFNRATIYKHYRDKFALLDDWVTDEFQRRLVDAMADVEWTGSEKLRAVLTATCESIRWIHSLGTSDDRLLRPIAEARMRILLLQMLDYGIAQDLLVPIGDPTLAAKIASSALYAAADEWVSKRRATKNLPSFMPTLVAHLSGVLRPNDVPSKGQSDFSFDDRHGR